MRPMFFLPDYVTGFNFLMALFGFLLLIGGVIIALMVKGRGEVSTLQINRADAAEALLKTRDAEIVTLNERVLALEEELEDVTAEHRALAGISIAKLMEYWAIKEDIEASIADKEREIRILRRRKDGDIS